jgi:phosphonate degradation associated HDIG domain protein
MMNKAETTVDEIGRLMQERGGRSYFGEPVSQLEHALQTAWLATQAQSPPSLIAAALLHDIGHLLHDHPENVAEEGIDTRHEEIGYAWLLSRFGTAVAEPVRTHVLAKRYLAQVEADYYARLSPTSVQSLALQGGPFSADEAREFEKQPQYRQAVQLRRWDDEAKQPELVVPEFDKYRTLLVELAGFNGQSR